MNFSINVTVYNKEFMIKNVLDRIKLHTKNFFELIIVLDGCKDDSEKIVINWLLSHKEISHKLLYADNVFETKANNLALRASTGDFCIIIQDDQLLEEPAWDERILKPFKFDDVFSVTGRAAHNYLVNPNSRDINNDLVFNDRWCDILKYCDPADSNTPLDIFAIRNSVNRGPWVLRHSALEKLNYLDEIFLMDMDEHDICYRARKDLGMVSGVYWINWSSHEKWGGTRDPITGNTLPHIFENSFRSQRIFYNRHKEMIKNRIIETRLC